VSVPLLSVRSLAVTYRAPGRGPFRRGRRFNAVTGVSFDLAPGETLGIVGESGCGKSSLARGLLGLVPVSGSVRIGGRELVGLKGGRLRGARRLMPLVYQDPLAALDPRMTVADIIDEPLRLASPVLDAAARRRRVIAIMDKVGLDPAYANRYPHEFSGGQCQRIGIARALITEPRMVICDEPVSALDVSIRAQIVNLLMDLQAAEGLALLFIAHDLPVVRHISHRVMVMYLGRVAEYGDAEALYHRPLHPYTGALIAAAPIPDPKAAREQSHRPLEGDLPSPLAPPSGCAFSTRCPMAQPRCGREAPQLRELGGVAVACHRAEERLALFSA
jgi:oligopeptide transport system ATP-binding protein